MKVKKKKVALKDFLDRCQLKTEKPVQDFVALLLSTIIHPAKKVQFTIMNSRLHLFIYRSSPLSFHSPLAPIYSVGTGGYIPRVVFVR